VREVSIRAKTSGGSIERRIGYNSPVFIVAEAACNHMCNMDLAKKMIDLASEAGVDAIKFQTYKAERLVTNSAVVFWGGEKISQLEYYKRLDRFGRREYAELFEYAHGRGIIGFSTPFDEESANMLADLGVSVFKIASCDIPNLKYIKRVARYGKPTILSTGASSLREIDLAVDCVLEEGNSQVILLACTLSYPTRNEEANLMRVRTLRERYPDCIVGLSDHTAPDPNMIIPSLAVALGARVIEKHYTLDRAMTGSGHFFAVDPQDLKKMVQNIRLAEVTLGSGELGVSDAEKEAWVSARRSIVAEKAIKKGMVIEEHMLGVKRPAIGLSPDKLPIILGKRAKVDIAADEFVKMDMLE